MRTCAALLSVMVLVCVAPAWGQQTLSSTQIQDILQKVLSQPRNTWLPAGTIQATHTEYGVPKTTNETTIGNEIAQAVQEYQNNPNKVEKTSQLQQMTIAAIPFNVRYRLANQYQMTSHVTVRYDHGRFYWEINADSRQDSVTPAKYGVASNYMARYFNMNSNQRRIFAWDGQKYTTYSASANTATVDTAGKLPRAVNGPLTAGLIPWGYGLLTQANLGTAQKSAVQNATGLIDMTLAFDGVTANLTLDPMKAYAVTKAVLTTTAGKVMTYTCSGYQQYGGYWVPSKITIERQNDDYYEDSRPTREEWTFNSISAATPSSFSVLLAAGTTVESTSPLSASTAIYTQSATADTDELLAQRLAFVAGEGVRPQNCATAALQQVASAFGKSILESTLARLVGPDGRTSLYDLKRCAESQGLFCRAIKTDLSGLRNLQGVQAILHLPGRSHFVVLNTADDRQVWLSDLSSRKFFYRRSADLFSLDWSEGTALLVSSRPIPTTVAQLPDAALTNIVGGEGYACNTLLQETAIFYCQQTGNGCSGSSTIYWERWGCGPAESGWCEDDQVLTRLQEAGCDWEKFYGCVLDPWQYYVMTCCN